MASVPLSYLCSVCGASSLATVDRLSDPSGSMVLSTRQPWSLPGQSSPDHPALLQRALEGQARDWLRWAACPRCGRRNPEGVAESSRKGRIFWPGLAALLVLSVVSMFVPWAALPVPALGLAHSAGHVVVARREGEPVRWSMVARGAVTNTVLIALTLGLPQAAFVVPLVAIVVLFWPRSQRDPELLWRLAASRIRFEEADESGIRR